METPGEIGNFFEQELQRIESELGNADVLKFLGNGRGMQLKHWAMLAAVLVAGYYIGTKYPNLFSKVTGA